MKWAIFCSIFEPDEILILGVVDNEIDAVKLVSGHYRDCDKALVDFARDMGNPTPDNLHLHHVFMVPCPDDVIFYGPFTKSYGLWEAQGFSFDRNLYVAPPVDEIPKSWAVA